LKIEMMVQSPLRFSHRRIEVAEYKHE